MWRKRERRRTEDSAVCGVGTDRVNNREGEFPFGEIFAISFVVCVLYHQAHQHPHLYTRAKTDLDRLQIDIIVPNLEDDRNEIRERNVVSINRIVISICMAEKTTRGPSGEFRCCRCHQFDCDSEQSARLCDRTSRQYNRGERGEEDALLLTISMYSGSVGQTRFSRQKRSIPCPRCRFSSSSIVTTISFIDESAERGRTSDGFLNFDPRLIRMNPAELLIREKVDVVGRVDRLGYSVDLVRDY